MSAREEHRRRKVWNIGGGASFRILGGGQGGQTPSRHMTLLRHVPTRFLINQCQIITFHILKSDIIKNSRIELRGIVLPVPSNQSYIYYHFTLQLGTFVTFSCLT